MKDEFGKIEKFDFDNLKDEFGKIKKFDFDNLKFDGTVKAPVNNRAALHYHVSSATSSGFASEILLGYAESRDKYQKTVQTIEDLTGEEPTFSDSYLTVFDNNGTVKWRACTSPYCLEG